MSAQIYHTIYMHNNHADFTQFIETYWQQNTMLNVPQFRDSNPGIPAHFVNPNPGIGDALIPGFWDYEKCKNARILQDICPKHTFSPDFGGNSRL